MGIARASRLLMLAFTASWCAQANPPLCAQSFTIEQILGAPFPTQLTSAHQGSRIAWVFADRGAQNVWIADGPAFAPRRVTDYTGDTGQPIVLEGDQSPHAKSMFAFTNKVIERTKELQETAGGSVIEIQ